MKSSKGMSDFIAKDLSDISYSSKTFLSPCLVCNSLYKASLNSNSSYLRDTKVKVFESCSKYLKVDTEKINVSLRWDFSEEELPFCAACFLSAHKISALHEQIQILKFEIDGIVQELTTSITKCHQSDSFSKEYSQEGSREECSNAIQEKIVNYRNLVICGSSLKAHGQNIRSQNAVESFEEIEFKNEPLSPNNYSQSNIEDSSTEFESYFEHNPDFEEATEQNIDNMQNNFQSKRKNSDVHISKSPNNSNKELAESTKNILEFHGMLNRVIVINLNRISKDKNGKWSTDGYSKETNASRFRKKEIKRIGISKPRIAKSNFGKTQLTENGNRICAGVLLIPSPDGEQICGSCGKKFATVTKVARHIRSVHAGIKQKNYYQRKNATKSFKLIKKAEGEYSYAGTSVIKLSFGGVQCGSCNRVCASMDAVMRHIRWYHLGDQISEVYRKRREIYHLKRKAALGYSVPKQDLLKAEEMLKNKSFLSEVLDSSNNELANLMESINENGSSSNKAHDIQPSQSRTSLKSTSIKVISEKKPEIVSSKINWKEDLRDSSEDEDDHILDNNSNDPDFSIANEECRSPEVSDFEAEESDCSQTSEEELTKEANKMDFQLVTQEGGKQLFGGIEIITVSETELQCGECNTKLTEMNELQEHIKNIHLKSKAEVKQRLKLIIREDGSKCFGGIEVRTKNKKLECGKCKRSFLRVTAVQRHIRTIHLGRREKRYYHNIKDLPIVDCKDGKKIYGGVAIENFANGKFRCGSGLCNKSFDSLESVVLHIRDSHIYKDHSHRLKIVFDKDGRKFLAGVEIKSKDGKEECGVCNKLCANTVAVQRHIRNRHLGLKQKHYHKRKTVDDLFFKMIDTEDGNKTYGGVTVKISETGRYKCGHCSKSFPTAEAIRRHIRWRHADRVVRDREDEPEFPIKSGKGERTHFTADGLLYRGIFCKKLEKGTYQCGFNREGIPNCNKIYPTSFALVGHIRSAHVSFNETPKRKINKTVTTPDGRKIYAGVEMVKLENGDLQCGACQKIFKAIRISCLMGHIIRVHEQREGGHFVCTVCGKNCGYKFNLAKHMLKHKESKSFVCDTCGLAYKQQSSLLHHQRQVHKGIKRHTCDLCGKQYYHTRDFIVHQRRHSGQKPFQCCVCGKNFYSLYEMKVHEKSHGANGNEDGLVSKVRTSKINGNPSPKSENRNDFDCNYCGKSLKTAAAAKRHNLAKHPDSYCNESDPVKKDCSISNVSLRKSTRTTSEVFSMPVLEQIGSATQNYVGNSDQLPTHLPSPPILLPMYDCPVTPIPFPLYGRPPYHPN